MSQLIAVAPILNSDTRSHVFEIIFIWLTNCLFFSICCNVPILIKSWSTCPVALCPVTEDAPSCPVAMDRKRKGKQSPQWYVCMRTYFLCIYLHLNIVECIFEIFNVKPKETCRPWLCQCCGATRKRRCCQEELGAQGGGANEAGCSVDNPA